MVLTADSSTSPLGQTGHRPTLLITHA